MLAVYGKLSSRSYATAAASQRVSYDSIRKQSSHFLENMTNNKLSFHEFKQKEVESFEEYLNSPIIKELFKGNAEKARKAYDSYCKSEYYEYQRSQIGGNPNEIT